MAQIRPIRVEFIPAEKWWHRAKWMLIEDFTSACGCIVAKAGFISDGASIPRSLGWLFSPTGRYFGAAIIHDYILVTEDDWDKANEEFAKELDAVGIKTWRKALLVGAVELYGWLKTKLGISIKV